MPPRSWTRDERDAVVYAAALLLSEVVLAAVYTVGQDEVARQGAAAGIYFVACYCALLFVARRRELREIARGVRSVYGSRPLDGYSVSDAVWIAAWVLSLGLVALVVSPDDAFGPYAHIPVVAVVGAAPVLKAVWDSIRR